MDRDDMLRLFEAHREAEGARDIDAILETFVPDPFLETIPLGLRSEGREAVRASYQLQFFMAFPDLAPADEGMAFGDDVIAVWGTLRGTSRGDWLGVPPGGGTFAVPFANVVPYSQGLMAGETIYFDLATLCEQARIPLDEVRTAAAARRGALLVRRSPNATARRRRATHIDKPLAPQRVAISPPSRSTRWVG